MNRALPDDKALAAVRPSYLFGYLLARGWKRAEAWCPGATIWVSGDEKTETLVPDHANFGDYAQRVADVVSTVAEAEKRSVLEVIRDLLLAPFDLTRISADGEGFAEGSLPLAAGVALVERAQQLMLSAACSTQAPRSNFLRTPKRAEEFMDRVRLGQTERGSYVVTLLVPMPLPVVVQPPPQLEMFGPTFELPKVSEPEQEPEPFERLVSRRLVGGMGALASAVAGAEKERSLDPFAGAVQRGVSANLCEAVIGAYEVARAEVISVGVTWATVGRAVAPVSNEPPSVVAFPIEAKTVLVLREARDYLRQRTEPEPDVEVRGHVVRLEKDLEDIEGRVTIFGKAGNRQRHVSVTLALES